MDSPMTLAITKILKGKSKLKDQEAEAVKVAYKECRTLHVEIYSTEGIDRDSIENPSPDPFNYDMRVYTVLAELGPGVGFATRREKGLPDPNWLTWRMVNMLPLYDNMENRYLYVEVVKLQSRKDPGTSRGQRVVGRVAIPLPKKAGQATCGRYGLVRQNRNGVMIAEGHINVAMKITKMLMYNGAAVPVDGGNDAVDDHNDAVDNHTDVVDDSNDEVDDRDSEFFEQDDDRDNEFFEQDDDHDVEFFNHV